jgi:hypothetical protein
MFFLLRSFRFAVSPSTKHPGDLPMQEGIVCDQMSQQRLKYWNSKHRWGGQLTVPVIVAC